MGAYIVRIGRVALGLGLATVLAGCYYVPTHRSHDGYRHYDSYYYVPHTDLSITYIGGSHRKHHGYGYRPWRGVPHAYHGSPRWRGEGHHRGSGRSRHHWGHRGERWRH